MAAAEEKKKKSTEGKILADNRKSKFEYFIIETLEAGVELKGTEVKACRAGKINLADGYAAFRGDELFLQNVHIGEYAFGNRENHIPRRVRKILLHRGELNKWISHLRSGFSIVPLKVYIKNRYIKILLGLAKGKKAHDKRDDIKARETAREVQRHFRKGS